MTVMGEPISDRYRAEMNATAAALDELFNGELKGKDRKVCFVLLITEFGNMEGGRVNYISNGSRRDCVTALKEILARFEGQPEQSGRA
jgi:hypothetical protein